MISVVIPVYNTAAVIEETIASVLSQTYKDIELILVDDGSKDDSVAIMRKYESDRVKVVENQGEKCAAAARNLGVSLANGDYITFLDADDLWLPEKLEKQLKFMQEKNAAFSFTSYEFADEQGKGLGKYVVVPDTITYEQALKNTTIFTSTVMFDMSMLTKEDIKMPHVASEDSATWWRLLRNGVKAYGLKDSLTLYRRSAGTLSSNKMVAIKRIWNLYRNVENLSLVKSAWCFCFWALRATLRRL